MSISTPLDPRLIETQRAFDSVASVYDGPVGNNELIQRMRRRLWRVVRSQLPPDARLLDLGCGTGIDAVYFASQGYQVVATDWSPEMTAHTRTRAEEARAGRIRVETLGIQELDRLQEAPFDGIYSDLGPLNCVLDLHAVARSCAALLKPNGHLIVSVIGRLCPWELVYYTLRGDRVRARLRSSPEIVPVNLNRHTVWTRYYTPKEFYASFVEAFELSQYQALSLFLPPPYLIRLYERGRPLFALLGWLDDHLAGLPGVRNAGDHFLMVLRKRD